MAGDVEIGSSKRYDKRGNKTNCVTVILECIYGTLGPFNTSFSRICQIDALGWRMQKNSPLPTHIDRFGSCNTCTIELWEQQSKVNCTIYKQFSRLGIGFFLLFFASAVGYRCTFRNNKRQIKNKSAANGVRRMRAIQ